MKIFWDIGPLKGFIIIGPEGTEFSRSDRLEWSPEDMFTLVKLRLGRRILLALVFINPLTAQAGDYTVTVGGCSATVSVEDF